MARIFKIKVYHMVQKLERTKKVIKVGKIIGKYENLTVEDKWISLIGDNTKRSLEMTPEIREIEAKLLKMRIKKRI